MRINAFAKLTGVSVRTLHYYDKIGLLQPSVVDDKGYRFYDDVSLERMQDILFYRELDFSLKTIAEILDAPGYIRYEALENQKYLLQIKMRRLERLISAIEDIEYSTDTEGGLNVDLSLFDNSEFEVAQKKYEDQVKEYWGNTEAYAEYTEKTAGYSKDKWNKVGNEFADILNEFAKLHELGVEPDNVLAQELARDLQNYINDHFYTCTKEVFSALGNIYVDDERFTKNIDKHGNGVAHFMSKAIDIYCKN